jgi:hypothetical protein
MKLNKLAFGYAIAIFDGGLIFVAMIYSLLFGKASAIMARVAAIHFAPYSFWGAIFMLVEHAIAGFILGWVFAWLYNKFVKELPKE